MTNSNDSAVPAKLLKPRCLVIDLEIGKKNRRLQQIGALRADTDESLHWRGGEATAGLDRLDALAAGAAFVLGHNKAQTDCEKFGEPRCERCEVVVPEFVFAPADGG